MANLHNTLTAEGAEPAPEKEGRAKK
jgi:hypothetical protein